MTKLCPRGKAAAKRKFAVYPSAYANAYASKICAGKIKDPSGKKRKDWGPKKAKVGMAVDAGSRSGLGRLEKSGFAKTLKAAKDFVSAERRDKAKVKKAKKGKMMIMIAIGKLKPKKMNKGGGFDAGTPGKVRDILNKQVRSGSKLVGERLTKFDMDKLKKVGIGKVKKIRESKKFSKGAIMNVANKLEKASKAHAGQAKTLRSIKVKTGGMADYYKDLM